MNNQELYDLIACFDRSTAQTMRLATQDLTIELTRDGARLARPAAPAERKAAAPVPAQKTGAVISAPLVGTFYAAPSPDRPPFVSVGDHVKKGQTVCLIEAMKMMSEVTAPCDCTIEEIVKQSGELAAFGEALFRYRPC